MFLIYQIHHGGYRRNLAGQSQIPDAVIFPSNFLLVKVQHSVDQMITHNSELIMGVE